MDEGIVEFEGRQYRYVFDGLFVTDSCRMCCFRGEACGAPPDMKCEYGWHWERVEDEDD